MFEVESRSCGVEQSNSLSREFSPQRARMVACMCSIGVCCFNVCSCSTRGVVRSGAQLVARLTPSTKPSACGPFCGRRADPSVACPHVWFDRGIVVGAVNGFAPPWTWWHRQKQLNGDVHTRQDSRGWGLHRCSYQRLWARVVASPSHTPVYAGP